MKIEIWSDIVCPFCYIGKRRFEEALQQFSHIDQLEIEYKSFQLNPNTVTNTEISAHQNLASHKGISVQEAKQMGDHVTNMAKEVGLTYDFDKAVVANTLKAHQMLHFAKAKKLQLETKEALLKAYFTDGVNIDDTDSLVGIGESIGLNGVELRKSLDANEFEEAVRFDIYEAQQLRIQGVPFYVFNRKYGISGAQQTEVFQQTLEKSFGEWSAENTTTPLQTISGDSCDVDGNC
ncbi:DsbA family oxidoreductase [Marinoscillum pacificum]|uniref:DsbA family oxidoreductase n=1 Tax=Marinoscillum pacificum TaxID=392723 RepID=UPI0021580C44|nr:DsbA family oxidoreductase [Marinoscillum pacificum]